jgi:hypothetical protein
LSTAGNVLHRTDGAVFLVHHAGSTIDTTQTFSRNAVQ